MITAATQKRAIPVPGSPRAAGQVDRRVFLLGAVGAVAAGIVAFRFIGGSLGDLCLVAATSLALGTLVHLGVREIGRIEAVREHRLEALVANATEAVAVIGLDGVIKFANPAAERIIGIPAVDSVGRPVFDFFDRVHPDERGAMAARLQIVLRNEGATDTAQVRLRAGDEKTYRWLEVAASNRSADPAVGGVVMNMRDLTDQVRANQDVNRLQSAIEEASGAARKLAQQRALVAETIRNIDARSAPEDIAQSVCAQVATIPGVAMASIFIFDHAGPLVPYGMALVTGQAVPLRQVPRTRSKYLRDLATGGPWIESWGGHPNHPYNELLADLGVRAHAYAPVHDGDQLIGVLVVGSAADRAEEELAEILPAVVECADICGTLIGVPVAKRTEATAQRERMARISDRHEFTTVFQPLIDTLSGSVVGYEALTRFADGMSPDERFAEAHAAGVGVRLEVAAVKSALEAAATLPGQLWLNVNASPQTVASAELKRLLEQTSRELVLEVTEHKEITDYPAFRQAARALGARVRLAVDDAGAGFAGLRHIVELRPSFVKLDRQLITNIDSDDARQAMVAGMVHFARNSGCWLIAEGVETEAELACLRSLQLRYMQGYLLGTPAAPERFVEDAGRWIGR